MDQISNNVVTLSPSLYEAGRVKIGMKGEARGEGSRQMPVKLDHFIVVGNHRDKTGNFVREDELMKKLPKDDDGKIRRIPITFLYDDMDLNFISSYSCYMGRSLMCRGDGRTARKAVVKDGKLAGWEMIPCSCPLSEFGYEGKDKCKLSGRLQFVIRGAERLGGVYTFRTTSVHSIKAIMSAIMLIKRCTGGPLAGIPLEMSVNPRQVTSPDGRQQTAYVIGLEYVGDFRLLQDSAKQILLDNAKYGISIQHIEEEAKKLMALAPTPFGQELDEDDKEEFFPEAQPVVVVAGSGFDDANGGQAANPPLIPSAPAPEAAGKPQDAPQEPAGQKPASKPRAAKKAAPEPPQAEAQAVQPAVTQQPAVQAPLKNQEQLSEEDMPTLFPEDSAPAPQAEERAPEQTPPPAVDAGDWDFN